MTRRLFTPALANRALPLVSRIVADILDAGRQFQLEEATSGSRDTTRLKQLRREVEGYMAELNGVGCVYKDGDFDLGLVDFPAIIDGKPVLLCWRSDEPEVAHYHDIEAGFAGRAPIPAELMIDDEVEEQSRRKETLGSELD